MIQIREVEKEVKKKWGKEVWIVNNDKYCGKILCFRSGTKFSFHFHKKKSETFYVLSGLLKLTYLNLENADKIEKYIKVGDVVDVPQFEPHRLEAINASEIIEFSTHHEDSDSYRIEKGDSQI